jgi:nucleoside-diphosphate-sugar epimerase
MRVGITGAAGFIGSWLADELRAHGYEVFGTDRNPGPHVRDRFDLLDRNAVSEWTLRYRPDVVVHLAAQVGRLFGEDDTARTVRWNAEDTALVALAAAAANSRVVYASTSEVYGDHGTDACDEDIAWRLPANLYGLSKGWGEQVCRLYAPDGLVIIRPSMPYGPGVPPGRGRRAMDTMLWQGHHRMPITVHRGAERSWCWIGDTVRAIRLAIDHPGVYNVGRDDDPRSMLEIAQLACKLAGAPDSLIVEVDPPAGQTVVKRLPTDRIRALGWAPSVELEDGMARVYEWIKGFDAEGNR